LVLALLLPQLLCQRVLPLCLAAAGVWLHGEQLNTTTEPAGRTATACGLKVAKRSIRGHWEGPPAGREHQADFTRKWSTATLLKRLHLWVSAFDMISWKSYSWWAGWMRDAGSPEHCSGSSSVSTACTRLDVSCAEFNWIHNG
jgi:hypothetical protein